MLEKLQKKVVLLLILFIATVALTACGGGSSNSNPNSNAASNASMLGGAVTAPGGTLASVSTGYTPIANATVTLLKIDNAGNPLSVQPAGLPVVTTTDATGKYHLTIPTGVVPGSDLVVEVGSGASMMRSIVSNPNVVDINPATEAATQLIANGVNNLVNFTAAEVEALKYDVITATATVTGSSIASAVQATVAAANADSTVTTAITAAATLGQGGAPTIAGFNATSAAPGTQVTITGSNFSTTLTDNVVKFNGVQATVISATATQIVTTIPSGALSGSITITVGGSTATSSSVFTVLSDTSLVGSWIVDNNKDIVLTILDSSHYLLCQASGTDSSGTPGVQTGTYAFDPTTRAFTTTSHVVNTMGQWGLDVGVTATLTINGNTFTSAPSMHTFTKIMPDNSLPLVGGWIVDNNKDIVLTFINGTNYILGQASGTDPNGTPGVQTGTYTFEPTTGAFTTTSHVVNTMGQWGMDVGVTSTLTINGNTFTSAPSMHTATRVQ